MKERVRREHLELIAQLKGMARNLNQLTRSANATGLTAVKLRHASLLVEIETLLKRLRDDR